MSGFQGEWQKILKILFTSIRKVYFHLVNRFFCQNGSDRSNVAFQNVGSTSDGSITLKIAVFDASSSFSQVLPSLVLQPRRILPDQRRPEIQRPLSHEWVYQGGENPGVAPYYAYGVVNDQGNSDGSFIVPQPASTAALTGLTLPVIVQTSSFLSEVVLANFSTQARTVNFSFVGDAVPTADKTAHFTISIPAGRQQIIPVFSLTCAAMV